jgi:REP element-mobilizing transposase RayT
VSQAFTQLYAHLIFSTKDRYPWIDTKIRKRVHAYLAGTLRKMDSPWVVVGGVPDHVHTLFDLGRTTTPANFVEELKRDSSKFIKTLGQRFSDFYWQRGYGMFSVSPTHRAAVERYVREQEEHHRRQSYQEEFLSFLKRYKIKYDPKTIWD